MTAEIVNLRRARKAKARAGHEAVAAENRVRFGRTKDERRVAEAHAAPAMSVASKVIASTAAGLKTTAIPRSLLLMPPVRPRPAGRIK